jgi:transcriptional regulator with XRE-family HTH domain
MKTNHIRNVNIGETLRALRLNAGMNIEDVLYYMKECGIKLSKSSLYAYENNHKLPSIEVFFAFCKSYNIENVLTTFNLKYGENQSGVMKASDKEADLIRAYRKMDDKTRQIISFIVSQYT